jgi:hypothetical protein
MFLAMLTLGIAARAIAAAPELQISLRPEQHLRRDAHTAIEVIVQLPEGSADLPLLLTPRIEGAAVELVRGRLLRSDAKLVERGRLRFEVPVVARSEGTAILRVSVTTYVCEDSCRRVEATTSAVLEVR